MSRLSVNVVFKHSPGTSVKPRPALLARAVRRALPRAKGEVNLVFVGGPEIIRLNKAFIGKSHRTDVIAFNYPPCPAPGAPFGDIFVCLPQARQQARELGHAIERELLLLALHGALHLAGMDDDTAARRAEMHRRAERLAAGLTDHAG